MQSPEVSVTQIKKDEVKKIVGKKPIDLGGKQNAVVAITETQLEAIKRELADGNTEAYFLKLQGGKVPRGVKIQGQEIGWTQNGQVMSTEGKQMGVYDRLVEFGGKDNKEQSMIVYVNGKPLVLG